MLHSEAQQSDTDTRNDDIDQVSYRAQRREQTTIGRDTFFNSALEFSGSAVDKSR